MTDCISLGDILEKNLSLGEKLQKKGDFKGAIEAYDRVIDYYESNSKDYGNDLSAADEFMVGSHIFHAHRGKIICLIALGIYDNAVEACDAALKNQLQPVHSMLECFNIHKGICLYYLRRYEEALECFNLCSENGVDRNSCKGFCLGNLGRSEEALECFNAELQTNPKRPVGYPVGYRGKGNCLRKLGRYEEALECFDAAVKIDPKHILCYRGKGECLCKLDRYDEALECFDAAVKIDPQDSECYRGKGECLRKLGRYGEALECFNIALQTDPHDSEWYRGKGNSFLKENGGKTLEWYNAALQIDPQYSVGLYNGKGDCLRKLGRYDEAQECFNAALQINDPHDSEWYRSKGDCLLEHKRYEEALECYNAAIKIDPQDFKANFNKGNCLLELNRYEEALECYNAAKSIDKDSPEAISGLGRAYYFKEEYELAKVYLEKSLKICRESTYTLFYLGKTLDKMCLYDDAIKVLRDSLISATDDRTDMLSVIQSEINRITEYKHAQEKAAKEKETGKIIQVTVNGDVNGSINNNLGGIQAGEGSIVNRSNVDSSQTKDAIEEDTEQLKRDITELKNLQHRGFVINGAVNAPIKNNMGGIQADDESFVIRSNVDSSQTTDAIANENRRCPFCGSEIEDGQRYCNICGRKLND